MSKARAEEMAWYEKFKDCEEVTAESQIVPGLRRAEPVCDVQRFWTDVGSRPTQSWQWQNSDSSRRVHRRARGGAKPSTPDDHEELESSGQKACHSVSARLAYLAHVL